MLACAMVSGVSRAGELAREGTNTSSIILQVLDTKVHMYNVQCSVMYSCTCTVQYSTMQYDV